MQPSRLSSLAIVACVSSALDACAVYDPQLLPRGRDGSVEATSPDGTEGETGVDAALDTDAAMDVPIAMGDSAADGSIDVRADGPIDTGVDVRADVVATDGGCPPGQTDCGGTCVDLATSATHCGACFNACPAVFNGAPRCRAGACSPLCTPPATPYDDSSCIIASTDACPTAMTTSWVTPNQPHVRFDTLTRTPTSNVTLGGACATSTGADQVFTLTAQVAVNYQVELFSEAFDGAVAIRTAPCGTTPMIGETCSNATARAGRELVATATPIAATTAIYVIAKARTTSSGPFAIAVTPSATCTNRALNGAETCDDGNLVTGDGCDTGCTFSATTSTSCALPPRHEAIRAALGTQRYLVNPAVVTDSQTLPCGTASTRDFVTFVTPSASGRLEVRGGANESVALYSVGCAGRPLACAGLGVSSFASVTAGTTYALVVESPLRPLAFSLTLSQCGNGAVEGSEECDDGNMAAGDGCTVACVREASCELEAVASNTFASASRPRFSNCTVVPYSQTVGAVTLPTVSHVTLVALEAGDRVSATLSRAGGTAMNPWGVEILPESAGTMASVSTACNATLAYACSNDAGASSNAVTWVSPAGGNYLLRFFSQGVTMSSLNGTITIDRYPTP